MGGWVRTEATVSHNAQANSQTLILGIKLPSGWHNMARQSEARRPRNFSPLICEKMCGMTSAAIKTRKTRGGENGGCPGDSRRPTVAD